MLACLSLTLALGRGLALAGPPTVDGLFYGSGDDQRYVFYSTAPSGSKLYIALVNTKLYVALVVDRSVNDNVFDVGPGGVTTYMQSAGWNGHRTARRLCDSEFATFSLNVGEGLDQQSWTWRQGYAGQPGVGAGDLTNNETNWVSGINVAGGAGTPPPGYEAASSMAWNMNNYATRLLNGTALWTMSAPQDYNDPNRWKSAFAASSPNSVIDAVEGFPPTGQITYSPSLEWEWSMVYEWSIDLSDITAAQTPVFVLTGSSHHSPAKTGPEDDDFPDDDPDPLMDFGDLPAPYPTLLPNGARHVIDPFGARLGAFVDAELDGQTHPLALGDDLTGVDDEDGVALLTPLIPGTSATFEITIGEPGYVSAFIDWDADGTLDAVNIDSVDGGNPAVVTTGLFSDTHFSAVGTYRVDIAVPLGAEGMMPARFRITNNAGDGGASPAGLATSGEVEDYIFTASIGDFVWFDENQDGIQDPGEPGFEGVTVRLYAVTDSGATTNLTDTTVTDANGAYLFENLPGGDYFVEVVPPAGYVLTLLNVGSDSELDSDADPATGRMAVTTLAPGETDLSWDAGLYAVGTIGDTVFYDWNGNGQQDPGEAGIPGVSVTLTPPAGVDLGNGDGQPITTVTDANGLYLFSNLPPGAYTVSVPAPGSGGVPADYVLTASPDDPVSLQHTVELTVADPIYLDADFGYQPAGDASLAGNVFEDADQNALFDLGETGITNVTVWLYHDVNGNGQIDVGDPLIASTTTDANGTYSFSNLDPNLTYLVLADDGNDSGVDDFFALPHTLTTSANPLAVTPADFAAQSNQVTDVDFGYYAPEPGSISGHAFEDVNNDGLLDPGDIRLPSVTVFLYLLDPVGQRVQVGVTETDVDGFYLFENLPPGTYIVVIDRSDPDIPLGLVTGVPEQMVSLSSGDAVTDVDFPFVPLLEKTVDNVETYPGSNLVYSIRINPPASAPLNAVTVADPVPENTYFVSASHGGQYDPVLNRVVWNLGTTSPGTQGTLTLRPRLFAFRGGDTETFWQYDVNAAQWSVVEDYGSGIGLGGALISTVPDGGATTGDVFGMRGNDTRDIQRYNIFSTPTNEWVTVAPLDSVNTVDEGGKLATLGGLVYALVGNNTSEFRRYEPGTDTWAPLAPTPQTVGRGSAFISDRQQYLFALRGNNSPTLWRYDPVADVWSTMSPAPANLGTGVGGAVMSAWAGNLYVFRGEGTTTFWRYHIASDTWSATAVSGVPLPPSPIPVTDGAALTFRSVRLFLMPGGGTSFLRYNINENSWTVLPDLPAPVLPGSSLASAGGVPARENEMFATPYVVRNGDLITVRVNLSACQNCPNDTGISPPPLLSVTGVGGAEAVKLSGPEPAPQDIPSGISRYYFYTYQAIAGPTDAPQSLTFAITNAFASGAVSVFPPAAAASVIVIPDLTMTVTVDPGFEGGTITNTAYFFGETRTGQGICYALAASSGCGDGINRLVRVSPNGVVTDLGATGTSNAMALAWAPDVNRLYTADGQRFGSLNINTGAFQPIGDIVAAVGTIEETALQGGVGDIGAAQIHVASLAFDSGGDLYAVLRRPAEPDLLFRIDPATGKHVPEAFGPGRDYRVILPVSSRGDIPSIDFAPNGVLYGIAATVGSSDGDLLVILPDPGAANNDLQPVGVNNGLSPQGLLWEDADLNGVYDPGEELYGVTGLSILPSGVAEIVTGAQGPGGFADSGFWLDLAGGRVFWLGQPGAGCNYQAVACRSDEPFQALDGALSVAEIVPTLAVISAVRSRIEDGEAVISWDVELEIDTLGYYIERWVEEDWLRINETLIESRFWEMPPITYEQADPGAPLGTTQRYRIVELDGTGRLLHYGPYDLELDGGEISYETWAAGILWGDADSSRDTDPDGDGLTNWQEYLAGTEPLNANSVLRVTRIRPVVGGIELTWSSEPGRVYAVEFATSPNGPFMAIATDIPAKAPTNRCVVLVAPGAVKAGYFRVIVIKN